MLHDVIVIGAGPVGLIASLLLSKYRVPHVLAERRQEPTDHPQAHFINTRTMEILRQLDGLDARVRAASTPLAHWQRFVYCTGLVDLPPPGRWEDDGSDTLLGMVDHFPSGPDRESSPVWPAHLPQHEFVDLLREKARSSRYCMMLEGQSASVTEHADRVDVLLTHVETGDQQHESARYVICADGAHSDTRQQLDIELKSNTGVLQHLINVHFFSRQLAGILRERLPAMLYFIFSTEGVGVLVNHCLDRGEFVLQIPYFPPLQRPEDFTSKTCTRLIQKLAGDELEIGISSARAWRMGTWSAERFRSGSGRCFLIGDAAHQFPPSGGFGMNLGIDEAHNLVWKLSLALNVKDAAAHRDGNGLLASFEAERIPLAATITRISVANFKKPIRISNAIGLDWQLARLANWAIEKVPGPDFVKQIAFKKAMQAGLAQVELLKSDNVVSRRRRKRLQRIFDHPGDTLQLLFPKLDLGVVYKKGWLAGEVETDFYDSDDMTFTPDLITGGRLPHFWLQSSRRRPKEPVSSLDLPSMLVGKNGRPQHAYLVCGAAAPSLKDLDETLRKRFEPIKAIVIGKPGSTKKQADYVFAEQRPSYLPASFAAIIRPDGHVGWLKT